MKSERDELVNAYQRSRKAEGDITARHAPVVEAKRKARDAARQALADAETAVQRAEFEHRAELNGAWRATAAIERRLELSVPAEVPAALAQLDAATSRIQEVSARDVDELAHLRRLLELRGECRDLHLLPANVLKGRLARIADALTPRETEMYV